MKIVCPRQHDEAGNPDPVWLNARLGIVTASDFDKIFDSKFLLRKGDMLQTYLSTKVAEKWWGAPADAFYVSEAMEAGTKDEPTARAWFAGMMDMAVTETGLIVTEDGRVGCSPDGLCPGGVGLELKCPLRKTHIQYLRDAELPAKYAAQVHGSLYVTGYKRWYFMSFCAGAPAQLILPIDRDEAIQQRISEGLKIFLALYSAEYEKIVKLHGGPPDRPASKPEKTPEEKAALADRWQNAGRIAPDAPGADLFGTGERMKRRSR